jgi:D-3-phosphoglycerate dehydrogenase
VRRAQSVAELLRASDFVTLHVPLLDATRHLIDAQALGLLRADAVVLNFAREGVVDEAAVRAALEAGSLRHYVCDFPSEGLIGHPKAIALPHLGASTGEAEENCAVMVVDQLRDFLEHGNLRNAVNFPNASMPRESAFRVAIANANVPNMLGQISTAMAAVKLNIHNLLNKSRGDLAYTQVDVDSAVPPEAIAGNASIAGVL